jgi:hypothetical protein
MATNDAIREGIAARLGTIEGLQVYPRPPGTIVVPAAVVRRRIINYDATFDGVDDTVWSVTVFVSFANTDVSVEQLDSFCAPSGASSVVAAIHADPTLGGVVDFARVTSAEGEKVTNYAGTDYLSAEFAIEIGD